MKEMRKNMTTHLFFLSGHIDVDMRARISKNVNLRSDFGKRGPHFPLDCLYSSLYVKRHIKKENAES